LQKIQPLPKAFVAKTENQHSAQTQRGKLWQYHDFGRKKVRG
jgi:hypothetical protein